MIFECVILVTGCVLLGMLGTANRYCFLLRKDRKATVYLSSLIINSAFTSLLTAAIAWYFKLAFPLAFLLSGLLGHGGPDGMDWIRKLLIVGITGYVKTKYNESGDNLSSKEVKD